MNVTIVPVFIGDRPVEAILEALQPSLMLSKKGSEVDLQPLLNPTSASLRFVKAFEGFIPRDDWKAMRIAFAIVELEDAGETERSSRMMRKLQRRYQERGKHIYNLCRSELIEWLEILLGHLKFQFYAGPQKVAEEFRDIWEGWMEYCKVGIFLNDSWTEDHFDEELSDRFVKHGMHEVHAFARGRTNVDNLRFWTENFVDAHSRCCVSEREPCKLGDSPALRIKFEWRDPPSPSPAVRGKRKGTRR